MSSPLSPEGHLLAMIQEALADTLERSSPEGITLQSRLKEDLKLDSMSSLHFLMQLEERIPGFHIDPETLTEKDFFSVETLLRHVQAVLSAFASPRV